MTSEITRIGRLEALKQKNAARLRRVDAAVLLTRAAPIIAARCDRFSIGVDDERAAELRRVGGRLGQSGDWYRRGVPYGAPHEAETRAALVDLTQRHGLTGWVEFNADSPNTDLIVTIGIEAAALPEVIPALLDLPAQPSVPYRETLQLDDCWLINREANWGLLLWHEGLIIFERAGSSAAAQIPDVTAPDATGSPPA